MKSELKWLNVGKFQFQRVEKKTSRFKREAFSNQGVVGITEPLSVYLAVRGQSELLQSKHHLIYFLG